MVGKETQGVRLRADLPGQDRRRQGLRRASVGAAQGRLPARPDPRQRREEGAGRRGGGAGQEVRHHHAVHQLPDRAGRPRAGRRREAAGGMPNVRFNAPAPPGRRRPWPRVRADGCRRPSRTSPAESAEGRRPGGQPRQIRRKGLEKDADDARGGQGPQGRPREEGRLRRRLRLLQSKDRTPSRPASWASICPARRPTCATRRGWTETAVRSVCGRNCLEFGGVWIDEGFDAKMPTLAVKAQSDAYFRFSSGSRRSRTSSSWATTWSG